MELNTDGNSCLHCLKSFEKLTSIDDGINICSKCLLKAYLLINPINFNTDKVEEDLQYLKDTYDDYQSEDLLKFIEFVRPFLESKK